MNDKVINVMAVGDKTHDIWRCLNGLPQASEWAAVRARLLPHPISTNFEDS